VDHWFLGEKQQGRDPAPPALPRGSGGVGRDRLSAKALPNRRSALGRERSPGPL